MTTEQQEAQFLIQTYGKERAIEHCQFVLSVEFGLWKIALRVWWGEVLKIIVDE